MDEKLATINDQPDLYVINYKVNKMKREAGKGDAPRKGADQEAYASGWDRIFKKKPEMHTCPFKEDVDGDYTTLCDCDPEQLAACANEI